MMAERGVEAAHDYFLTLYPHMLSSQRADDDDDDDDEEKEEEGDLSMDDL